MNGLRNFPRFKMEHVQVLSVELNTQAVKKILDVSLGGLGVLLEGHPPLDLINARLVIGKNELQSKAQVVWQRSLTDEIYRLGLRLHFEKLEDYKAWETFQKALWNKRQ